MLLWNCSRCFPVSKSHDLELHSNGWTMPCGKVVTQFEDRRANYCLFVKKLFYEFVIQLEKIMSYHARNSSDFVGLRVLIGGRKQIVCDNKAGHRVLLNVCDSAASDAQIDEALKEGINSRNLLGGVILALQTRNISVDFAN